MRNSTWEKEIDRIRPYVREAIELFFKKGLIDDGRLRRKYLNSRLIFGLEPS